MNREYTYRRMPDGSFDIPAQIPAMAVSHARETNKARFQRAVRERDEMTVLGFAARFATYRGLMQFAERCGCQPCEVESLLIEAERKLSK